MSEKPIIFSAPMIKAILEDRKTQTRRIVSKSNCMIDGYPPHFWDELLFDSPRVFVDPGPSPAGNAGPYLKVPRVSQWPNYPDDYTVHRVYPRWWIGDKLWVKETWRPSISDPDYIIYRADLSAYDQKEKGPWKSPLFLPRKHSRITLEITGVRVERLREISEEDAKAEGASCTRWFQPVGKAEECGVTLGAEGDKWNPTWDRIYYRNGFANVWESIHGPDSWQASPWVWVLEFRRVI